MVQTLNLGRRIELHSMDAHCQGVSLALYRWEVEGRPRFLVHTYSSVQGARERVEFIQEALQVTLGMQTTDAPAEAERMSPQSWLQFPCRSDHLRALKRSFLDVCKLETGAPLVAKPLTVFDKKADGEIEALSRGSGLYEIRTVGGVVSRRTTVIAQGFAKLCEMKIIEDDHQVVFPCKTSHDAMVGMLMFRAQNVRGTVKEEEMSATRGVLSAPSQQ